MLSERSYEPIKTIHLDRLYEIGISSLLSLFARQPYSAAFENCLKLICLGQGGARHYIDKSTGVKDFDLWCFFSVVPRKKFPPRLRLTADFGQSEFGRNPEDRQFEGRRIDIMGRDAAYFSDEAPEVALKHYLTVRATKTARLLSEKPMIGVWPSAFRGKVLWPGIENAKSRNV